MKITDFFIRRPLVRLNLSIPERLPIDSGDISTDQLEEIVNLALVGSTAVDRCVSLIASMASLAICGGGLRVVDGAGRPQSSQDKLLHRFSTGSLDGLISSATWIEDWMSDLLRAGNALARVTGFGSRKILAWRLRPYGFARLQADGTLIYQATDRLGKSVSLPGATVAHARWPLSGHHSSGFFAESPTNRLKLPIEAHAASVVWLRRYFVRLSKGERLHMDMPDPVMGSDQLSDARKGLIQSAKTGIPIATMGGTKISVLESKSEGVVAIYRASLIEEVARIYGVPSPLIGVNVTQWGQGIAELARLAWRFGASGHIDRILSALSLRMLPDGLKFLADPTDINRGDHAAVATLLTALQGDAQREPVADRSELRRLAGLPPE